MTTEFSEAKQLAKQFRAFVKLSDELEKVGSIEQLTAQANSHLALAKKNLADVERQIVAAEQRRDDTKTRAAEHEGELQRETIRLQGVLNDLNGQIKAAKAEWAKIENAKKELRRQVA